MGGDERGHAGTLVCGLRECRGRDACVPREVTCCPCCGVDMRPFSAHPIPSHPIPSHPRQSSPTTYSNAPPGVPPGSHTCMHMYNHWLHLIIYRPTKPASSNPTPAHPCQQPPLPIPLHPSHPIPSRFTHPIPTSLFPLPSHPFPSHPIPSRPIPSYPATRQLQELEQVFRKEHRSYIASELHSPLTHSPLTHSPLTHSPTRHSTLTHSPLTHSPARHSTLTHSPITHSPTRHSTLATRRSLATHNASRTTRQLATRY